MFWYCFYIVILCCFYIACRQVKHVRSADRPAWQQGRWQQLWQTASAVEWLLQWRLSSAAQTRCPTLSSYHPHPTTWSGLHQQDGWPNTNKRRRHFHICHSGLLMPCLHVKWNYFSLRRCPDWNNFAWNYFKIISQAYCSSWIFSNTLNVAEITLVAKIILKYF